MSDQAQQERDDKLARLIEQAGHRYYGINVCEIGEDGDYIIAAGHVEPRKMLAAANAYARKVWDLPALYDGAASDVTIRHEMCAVRLHDLGDECPWSLWWGEDEETRDTRVTVVEAL
jgi:hypothetical protein